MNFPIFSRDTAAEAVMEEEEDTANHNNQLSTPKLKPSSDKSTKIVAEK